MQPELTPESIVNAYLRGAFPMGAADGSIRWYFPDPRCVIDLNNFHSPRRLLRTVRKQSFTMRINHNFTAVIKECAKRETTWINEQIIAAYTELHIRGLAHSIEAYRGTELAGGLYGVSLGGAFMGESMFHKTTDASKVCLVFLVEHLLRHKYVLLDCQYMTEHLRQFGASLVSSTDYLKRLSFALTLNCRFQ